MATKLPIVVGYNDKKHSRAALVWAVQEARRRQAPLRVLFAANYPGMTYGATGDAVEPDPGALEAAEAVTATGVAIARGTAPELDIIGSTDVLSPSKALIEASSSAQLVVIGTRGRSSLLAAFLGSVAFTIAGRAACPVIVVKGDPTKPPAHDVVAVGTDGSPEADNAVRHAAEFAKGWKVPLEVICCTGIDRMPAELDRAHHGAEEIISRTLAALPAYYSDLELSGRIADAAPEQVLVEASTKVRLVVVGSRGRGAFDGLLLGSVSHAVIHGAQCPVAVIGSKAGLRLTPPM
ncbi:MAG TPA: universal stress protein [Actinopolymorphaceae bacterium]|jgi:nucleotide-binding universal stress UspA family protein